MGRYGNLDYPRLAKLGFILGLTMFITGVLGEFFIHAVLDEVDPIIDTTFFTLEASGLVIGLLSPFIFGIFLPLTE